MLKSLGYAYCCIYYYLRQIMETSFFLLAVLMGAFMIHKLVSWAVWVLNF